MKGISFYLISLTLCFFISCSGLQKKELGPKDLEIEALSSSIKLLSDDMGLLKNEILKINAKKPSVQRIIVEADNFWEKGDLSNSSSLLERALRIAKNESAVYLRLSHLRLEQGLTKESHAFASRGLINKEASAWEVVLLSIYTNNS